MKISIEQNDLPIYNLTQFGMMDFDIPPAQVDWISNVFSDFHKAQEYLRNIYKQGPGTKDF